MNAPDLDTTHSFGPFQLLADQRLLKNGREIALRPKERAVLQVLVEASGRVITKDDLIRAGWGARAMGDESLVRCVRTLRRQLGRDPLGVSPIATVYGVGYRLMIPVLVAVSGSRPAMPTRIPAWGPTEPRVVEAYLEARNLLRHRSAGRMRQAIVLLERARAWDPHFTPNLVCLADCYSAAGTWTAIPPQEARQRAGELLALAARIDPHSPGLRIQRAALTAIFDWDFDAAVAQARSAVDDGESDSESMMWYGRIVLHAGDPAAALQPLTRAHELDPLSPMTAALVGYAWMCTGKLDEALAFAGEAVDLDPESEGPRAYFAIIAAHAGRHEDARRVWEFLGDDVQDLDSAKAWSAAVTASAGRKEEARAVLAAAEAAERFHAWDFLAIAAAILGDLDTTVSCLEKALALRCPLLPLLRIDPRLDPVRQEPQVKALLARIGPRRT